MQNNFLLLLLQGSSNKWILGIFRSGRNGPLEKQTEQSHFRAGQFSAKMLGKILLICLLPATACRKNDGVPPPAPTPEQLLTKQEWVLQNYGFDDNENSVIDAQESMIKDCELDNTFRFHDDGSGSFRDNENACGGPVSGNFIWEIPAGDSLLKVENSNYKIIRISNGDLQLSLQEYFNVPLLINYRWKDTP